jgi:hypothetical protein
MATDTVVTDTVVTDTVVTDTVVTDTVVTDTVAGAVNDAAVSDAAGMAVPAGVDGQASPEPFVPGSGDRVPAELRLVLAGYVGIAFGSFAGSLACAAAAVVVWGVDGLDTEMKTGLFLFAVCGVVPSTWPGGKALDARSRFSRLLRRPSAPRTATVLASERGGRTLILNIPRDGAPRGYQTRSEVRLASWLKADMLVPGETVTVYRGLGVNKYRLLVSSAQRGRAFLGTEKS